MDVVGLGGGMKDNTLDLSSGGVEAPLERSNHIKVLS